MAGVRVPIVPLAHEYLVTQPFRERDGSATCRRCATPTCSSTTARRAAASSWAATSATARRGRCAPTASTRIPPDFNGILLEEDWDRFEEIAVNSRRRVPAMEDVKVTRLINGPEAFTPDNEFLPRRERGRAASSSPPGFCAHGLAGAGGLGKAMAEWIVAGEPAMDLWEMDVRRFGAHYRSPSYTLKRTREVYETYYDIKYPGHERQAGRPLRVSSAYALAPRPRRGLRREVGLGARELVRVQRAPPATRRCARAAGRAGCGRRRSAPSTVACRERAGALRRVLVRQDRDRRPGRRRRSWSGCATTTSRAASAQITYTQMLNARGGIECDFTVTRRGGRALLDRDRHRLRQPRPRRGSAATRPTTARCA